MKKIVVAAAAAAVLSATTLIPIAQAAHPVQAANYIRGRVEAVNIQAKTITIGGHVITGFSVHDLNHIKVGEECEATYIVEANGTLRALIIVHPEYDRLVD
ncbi:MAG: hypothetical protein FJX64_06750 [Alphaproteobacteria bacterium]|nr:hypothetical protein [Alphaproteobacteria bacterium]